MSHDDERDNEADDGLRSLRAVWLSMPDEEPPARGLAELMAAARIKAEEMAPPAVSGVQDDEPAAPSLWERVVALLRRPPVLALASVTVLAGGAVLIGQRGDQMEASSPAAHTESQREAPGAASTGVAPPAADVPAGAAEPEATTAIATGAADTERAALDDPGDEGKAERASSVVATPPPSRRRPRPGPAQITAQRGGAGAMPEAADPTRPALELDGRTVPAPVESDDAVATADAVVVDRRAATSPSRDRAPTIAQLHARARAAADRDDCAAARTAARQIAKRDARYYTAKVATDPALTRCLP